MLGAELRRLADWIERTLARPRTAAFMLALAALGSLHGVALLLPEERFVAAFHDDAFYYFGVARNVAAGRGCTFDGIHATNGFHPLWMAAILPVFAIMRGDTAPLRVVMAIQIGFVALASILIHRMLLRRLGAGAVTAALALVAVPGSATVLSGGLESSLVLLILVTAWVQFERAMDSQGEGSIRWLTIGCLCAAAFLARFEALVLTPVCLILGRHRLRQDPRRAALLLVPPVLAAVAFVVWNRVGFGTWLPVSGLAKAEWASRATAWDRLAAWAAFPWLGSDLLDTALAWEGDLATIWRPASHFALTLAFLAVAWKFRRMLGSAVTSSRSLFLLLACVAWVGLDSLAGLVIEPWNRVPIQLCTAVLIGALASQRSRLAVALSAFLFVLALVRIPWVIESLGSRGSTYATYRHGAALWLRENTSEDSRTGSWNAGLLGYFSHRTIVNLDGLVNNRRYLEEVVVGRDLDGYLRRERIGRLADQACGTDPSLRPYLSRTGSERLEQEFEVEAVFADKSSDRCPGYVIWKRARQSASGTEGAAHGEAPR